MELLVVEEKKLEEGKHIGTITKLGYRLQPYEYTDIFVKPDGFTFELKFSLPTKTGAESRLGKLLRRFASLKVGAKVDLEKTLVGRRVEFLTISEETPRGVYAKIIDDSLKPVS